MIHKGSCHCGNIKFEAQGDIGPVLECNCSHCQRKGFLLWFIPREKFKLLTSEKDISTYLFNKHVIEHKFCAKCGTQPFAYGTDPQTKSPTAAINVRCIEGIDLLSLKRIPFDGKSM